MATTKNFTAVYFAGKTALFLTFLILLFYQNSFSNDQWYWYQPMPTGNHLNSVDFFNENTGLAAGVLGTILRTTNKGVNWSLQISNTNKDLKAVCFIDKMNCIAVGKSGLILKSENTGSSWTTLKSFIKSDLISVNFPYYKTGYTSGYNGTILKTTDCGNSWTEQISGTSSPLFCINFLNENTGFAGGFNIILKTTNGGLNWIEQNINISPVSQIMGISFLNDSNNIIAVSNSPSGNIYKTTNGGSNWNKYSLNLTFLYGGVVDLVKSMKFLNENTGFVITDFGTILKTVNSGVNWTQNSIFRPENEKQGIMSDLSIIDSNKIHITGGGCSDFTSSDGGASWSVNIGNKKDVRANYFINENTGYCVGENGKINKSTDGGLSWLEQDSETQEQLNSVNFLNENTGYTCGHNGVIMKTTNSGIEWPVLNSNTNADLKSIYFIDENTGVVCGENAENSSALILRTTDSGENWQKVYNETETGGLTSLTFINELTGYICGKFGEILKTTDSGISWIRNQISGDIFYSISFLDSMNGLVAGSEGVIYKTTDGGLNWNQVNTGFYKTLYNINFESQIYAVAVGEDGTILKSINGGNNWTKEGNLTINTLYTTSIDNNFNTTVFGSFGTILKQFNKIKTPSLSKKNENSSDFKLFQNYPNPFNPTTNLEFGISDLGFVTLKIYDMNGKEVAELVNGILKQGNHKYKFDASNLASGIYFYQLKTENFSETKRMILLK
jgi:photosystem II stability/assembly factor-like uncharacterized protein